MILTNALLAATFGIVTNFCHIVPVPEEAVPVSVEEIVRFTAGDPASPANAYFAFRNRATFGVRFGAVTIYDAPTSYVHMQDSSQIPLVLGTPQLTSNDVAALASSVLLKLVHGTNPVVGILPVVSAAGKTREGIDIPFFEVVWPKPSYQSGFGYFAAMEVDARLGRITSLHLNDPNFFDTQVGQQIRSKTYVPAPDWWTPTTNHPNHGTYSMRYPIASREEVSMAITSWLWLCAKLQIKPGTNIDLGSVDWANSCVLTNYHRLTSTDSVCRVQFQNRTVFLSVYGVAFAHTPADSSLDSNRNDDRRENTLSTGLSRYRTKDLTEDLQRKIVNALGVKSDHIRPYVCQPVQPQPVIGARGEFKRVLALWKRKPDLQYQGLGAEFDLETGDLVSFAVLDPAIIEDIAAAQGRTLYRHP